MNTLRNSRVQVMWNCVENYLDKWQQCRSHEWDGKPTGRLPIYDTSCPACEIYLKKVDDDEHEYTGNGETTCKGCPIFETSGSELCEGTPWVKMQAAFMRQKSQKDSEGKDYFPRSDLAYRVEAEYAYLVDIALEESRLLQVEAATNREYVTEFRDISPERHCEIFRDCYGAGVHYGPADFCVLHERVLHGALGSTEDFSTGWYSSRKELLTAKVTREGWALTLEVSVSGDSGAGGMGLVMLEITSDQHPEELFDRVSEGLDRAWNLAEEDRRWRERGVEFKITMVDSGSKIQVETIILPKDGDTSCPPGGDDFREWGFQGEAEPGSIPMEILDKFFRWATGYMNGKTDRSGLVVDRYGIELSGGDE